MSARARRKKKTAASRVRPFWFALILLLIAAGAAGYYAATWPGFFPKPVRVRGNRVVPAAEITARAQIAPHANLWLQNMRAAAARIRAIPYIGQVWIHRTLPANVTIVVTERVPASVVRTSTGDVLADNDLRVLQTADSASALPVLSEPQARVPAAGGFITDPRIRELHSDYAALAAAHVIVARVEFDKFGDLQAVMPGGVRLLLGDDGDLAQKSKLIAPVLSQVAAAGRRVAAIDLRAPKTPVVQYR